MQNASLIHLIVLLALLVAFPPAFAALLARLAEENGEQKLDRSRLLDKKEPRYARTLISQTPAWQQLQIADDCRAGTSMKDLTAGSIRT